MFGSATIVPRPWQRRRRLILGDFTSMPFITVAALGLSFLVAYGWSTAALEILGSYLPLIEGFLGQSELALVHPGTDVCETVSPSLGDEAMLAFCGCARSEC